MAKSKKSKNVQVQPRKKSKPLRELKSGFKILKIEMPPLNIFTSLNSKEVKTIPVSHYIYFKKHESYRNDEDTPAGCTIFVCNLPIDTTIQHLKHIFKHCGHIINCKMNKSPTDLLENSEEILMEDEEMENIFGRETYTTGITAHVVFSDEDGVERALAMKQKTRAWKPDNSFDDEEEEIEEEVSDMEADDDDTLDFDPEADAMPIGYKKWMQQYKYTRPRPKALKTRVDNYMVNFTRMEEIEKLELDKKASIVDEDGFTLVTRRTRRNTNKTEDGASVTAARYEDVKNLKPKKKELQDFYRFQMKEKKRNELADLRRKFEEDKKRIAELKSSRRFKPY